MTENWTDTFRTDADMTTADIAEMLRPVSNAEACEIFGVGRLLDPRTTEDLTSAKLTAATRALMEATRYAATPIQIEAMEALAETSIRFDRMTFYDLRRAISTAKRRKVHVKPEIPPGFIEIHATRDGDIVDCVWVEGVPVEVSDDDVRDSVEAAAKAGDPVAVAALPHIICAMGSRTDGVRVYRD